ncbi:MAG: glycine cleavage system aminomethyltransferase GcvT, partial [Bacteroidetes bacterium]|nr:glycine cleavage system aminomethyltransferase GcvT [Bacteroidota bacterium]
DNQVIYSPMCNENGGIIDDVLISRINSNEFVIVVNSSNIKKDLDWITENVKSCEIQNVTDDYALLALQGPKAENVLKDAGVKQIEDLKSFHLFETKLYDVDCIISRTGYTGEDGFELFFDSKQVQVWEKLLETGRKYGIKPIGLGARDTLRLEAGLMLYGNDIDRSTNPIEAGLGWITKLNKEKFIGQEALIKEKENGSRRKLVALVSEERSFPRQGYEITVNGKKVGSITSGTVSPVLEKPIALGYVDTEFTSVGTKVNFLVRGKEVPAEVVKLPFINK